MKITLRGTEYDLTPDEEYNLRRTFHEQEIRSEIENRLDGYEKDEVIVFDPFDTGTYASADDARADFIEKCTEDILEAEEIYDHSPDGYTPDYDATILDNAEYFEYLRKE